jgi:hypothetical protein
LAHDALAQPLRQVEQPPPLVLPQPRHLRSTVRSGQQLEFKTAGRGPGRPIEVNTN